jgi:hypothetical protein
MHYKRTWQSLQDKDAANRRTVEDGTPCNAAMGTSAGPSGWNVRDQLHLEQRNVVLELQLAFLQAAQLQLVGVTVADKHVDDGVEVAMFHVEFNNAALDLLDVDHVCNFRAV